MAVVEAAEAMAAAMAMAVAVALQILQSHLLLVRLFLRPAVALMVDPMEAMEATEAMAQSCEHSAACFTTAALLVFVLANLECSSDRQI